jgi:uncharacterized protein YegP (UPF0339 family)
MSEAKNKNRRKLIIEIDHDGSDQFLSRMRKNGETLNTGRGYNRKANARQTIVSIIDDIQSGNFECIDKTKTAAGHSPEVMPEAAESGLNFTNIAALGYEAYAKSTGNKTFRGDEMPNFDDLSPETINAWIAAAKEIVDVAVRAATA